MRSADCDVTLDVVGDLVSIPSVFGELSRASELTDHQKVRRLSVEDSCHTVRPFLRQPTFSVHPCLRVPALFVHIIFLHVFVKSISMTVSHTDPIADANYLFTLLFWIDRYGRIADHILTNVASVTRSDSPRPKVSRPLGDR